MIILDINFLLTDKKVSKKSRYLFPF